MVSTCQEQKYTNLIKNSIPILCKIFSKKTCNIDKGMLIYTCKETRGKTREVNKMKTYVVTIFNGIDNDKYIVKALSKANAKTKAVSYHMATMGKKVKKIISVELVK
jgi:hypothetical protein